MRQSLGARTGASRVETMIAAAIILTTIVIVGGGALIWSWGNASVEAVGANRAYDAVLADAAGYREPELVTTYDDLATTSCRAADDAVGYRMRAKRGEETVALTVCCPSALSSRPCAVRVAGPAN